MAHQYEREYHAEVHKYLHKPSTYDRMARLHRARYFSWVGRDTTVLEYGCGLGVNLAALPSSQRVGFDISEYAVAFCREKGVDATTDLTSIEGRRFDLVFTRHVLEHLENPLETLRGLRNFVAEGGVLVTILPEEPKFWPELGKTDPHDHLFSWSPRTAYNLHQRAGLDVDSVRRLPLALKHATLPLHDHSATLVYAVQTVADLLLRRHGEYMLKARPRT